MLFAISHLAGRALTAFSLAIAITSCATTETGSLEAIADAKASSQIARLIERLKTPDGSVMVVAHRGCWANAPENSIASIEACARLGADMVELDVRRTADGQLVLMHDETVDRTTNGGGAVTELTLDEITSLKLLEGAGGSNAALTEQHPPTFSEALEVARGRILINVDAKADVYGDVAEALEIADMTDHVLMKISAQPDDPRLRETDLFASVHFMPIVRETWGIGPLSELADQYADLDPVAFEVLFDAEQWFSDGTRDMASKGYRVWVNTLSPRHAAGHVDGDALAAPDKHWGKLIALGADMIQTDVPEALIAYLDRIEARADAPAGPDQSYVFPSSGDAVLDKTFPLFTLLRHDPAARESLATHPALRSLRAESLTALKTAQAECGREPGCHVTAMMMSDNAITAAQDALSKLAAPGGPLNALVREQMRPSGLFHRHAALDDPEFLAAAWTETATGVNRLYRVYGQGEEPRYPLIDSISYDATSERFGAIVSTAIETALDEAGSYDLFFDAWARIGLDLLLVNQRDEAGRYEPMHEGENAAAMTHAQTLDWNAYPYSAILIPGAGLRDEERGLSAIGALRARLGARRYHEGLAPFIIVSGGHVHPNKTPYAEAIEAKRALIDSHGVPEHAILIDPHARHTTTNLRNAARLLFRAGAPMEKPSLISTSRSQSAYIESERFMDRNENELGYQPQWVIARLSPHDLTTRLNLSALHVDPRDPLDP